MAVLPRYVLVEVIKIFAVSVTGLTLMVVLGFVGREAAAQGLPLMPTLRLIPYFLPETLRVTVPMTLLLACTTVFARISGANEVVAVKALGISPMVLLWPVFIFAFLMSLVTVWLNDLADSWGRNNIQRVAIDNAEEIIYSMLQSQHRYSTPNFSINVKDVKGQTLQHVTLSMTGRGNSPKMTINAEEAVLSCDRAEGVLKVFAKNGMIDVDGKQTVVFPDVQTFEIPLPDASRAHSFNVWTTLPLRSLPEAIATAQAEIEKHEQMMAAQAAYAMACGDFDDLTSVIWRKHENDQSESDVAVLSPDLRAAAPLGGRVRLFVFRAGRRPHGRPPPQPRLSHQFLSLLPADPHRLLSGDDLRRRSGEERQSAHDLRVGRQRHVAALGPLAVEARAAVLIWSYRRGFLKMLSTSPLPATKSSRGVASVCRSIIDPMVHHEILIVDVGISWSTGMDCRRVPPGNGYEIGN